MHRIYSSEDGMSIYLLVFNIEWLLNDIHDSESERNQEHTLRFIESWVNIIGRNSGDAPLLLLGTHKDNVIGETDRFKSNIELARTNEKIKLAHKIIGNCITSMPVYKQKKLRLHFPFTPGP